jgi:AraC-like DNA-binding protein
VSEAANGREFVYAAPGPALRDVVISLCGYRDDHPARIVVREHPVALVPVIIDFGGGWDVASPVDTRGPRRLGSFLAGMHDGVALVEPGHGPSRCVQVDLTPLGARRLLGLPMHELSNRTVPLDAVLGREAGELAERLSEAPGWPARFALIEAALLRRLDRARDVPPGVEWAWRRLAATSGAVSIGSLGVELGWSRRRLAASFREEVGLTPKTAARVLRFAAMVDRLRAAPSGPAWAELALDHGYFDQSHLVRDVRQLAGVTPTELLASLAPVRAGS